MQVWFARTENPLRIQAGSLSSHLRHSLGFEKRRIALLEHVIQTSDPFQAAARLQFREDREKCLRGAQWFADASFRPELQRFEESDELQRSNR